MSKIRPATILGGIRLKSPVLPSSRLITRTLGATFPDGLSGMTARSFGLFYGVPAERNPALDLTFDCYGTDREGNEDQGVFTVTTSIDGTWLNKTIFASPVTVTLSISGTFVESVVINASPMVVTLGLMTANFDGFVPFASSVRANWVKWSNVGKLDFTVGKDNVAGERPLDWKGTVYAIKKLGARVVVYGENGISSLSPAGTFWGLDSVYPIGLKGKSAVTGDDKKQFFIDKAGQLWKAGETLEKFDYSEYLSLMGNNLVMSYDALNNLVYICDGSVGYVYNPAAGSLGECQPNITGIASQGGVLYVTSPAAITTEPFEICTDIYDFSTRTNKTIFSLELGTDLTTGLYAAIDYRRDIAGAFATTPWSQVSPNGFVRIPAFGREFRIRAKTLTYEWFKLDYIKVSGVVHAH